MPFARPSFTRGLRMSSTLIGRSGREYVRDKYSSSTRHGGISMSTSHGERLKFQALQQSLELKREFLGNRHLRMHIDENKAERVLVYEYFDDNLLSLVKNNPNMSLEARQWISRELGYSLKEFHAKNWIHIDVKPDNVMINYSRDEHGRPKPERVVLGDLDCSLKLKGDKLLRLPDGMKLGNVMWRGPEAQTGKGIGKASDVISYGLVCLFTTTGVETLHPDFEQLKREGIEPELEIMGRLISFFGPVPSGLVAHVQDENWGKIMMAISESTADGGPAGPGRFAKWEEKDYPNLDSEAKRMLLRMVNLDPSKRVTMEEILEDTWWNV